MSASPQHEVLLRYALETFDAIVGILTEMDDETANASLPAPGSNSPYALLAHCLGMMRRWSSTVNLGREVPRDRDAEFRAQGSVADLLEEAARVRAAFIADVEATDLDAAPAARPADEPEGHHVVDCRAVLLHVVEELAQHLGHLEITRDVLRARAVRPWLLVLAGRAGTGKTTLASAVVRRTGAAYLRVDAVETALRAAGRGEVGAEGYAVAQALAASNLRVGNAVVVDAVHPVPESREPWAGIAAAAGARLLVVETRLDDEVEHRRRVEERVADIPGHRVPIWQDVEDDGWVPWDGERDGPREAVDTAGSASALARVLEILGRG